MRRRGVWQEHQEKLKQEIEERIKLEPEVLQTRLRRICGEEFEIRIHSTGKRVIAEVDGLLFVSTYHDTYSLVWPRDLAVEQSAVCLPYDPRPLFQELSQKFGNSLRG